MTQRNKPKRFVKIPFEYFDAIQIGNQLFPYLFQFENGLRLMVHNFLSTCYGPDWWNVSLQTRLRDIFDYAQEQKVRKDHMPWIGNSARVKVLPIHLITLGQLEKIIEHYQSDCIPQLFPNMHFFLGHMEVIKRVRNLYSHMFPCITHNDFTVAKREIRTLCAHINARL